ncbi:MAG TPA: hypothetical protein VN540_09940 [Clostridia bacterium]|nr:hypothetical protein [Clostridia bacterium]
MARRRFHSKNRALTFRRVGLLLLGAALLALIVWGISALVREKDSFGTVAELPFVSDAPYVFTGTGFYYIAGDSLVYYDLSDPEEGGKTMKLGTTEVFMRASSAQMALYSGNSVQILGVSEAIDAGGTVLGIRCGATHTAVMRQDASGAAAVLVYDAKGTLIDAIEQDAELLVDCGLRETSSGDVLWTLMLDSSGSVPVNTITTYTYEVDGAGTPRASMSGVMTVQGQLVERVVFTQKSIFVAGTSHLIRCDAGVSGEAYRLLTYGYRLADVTGAGTTPLFVYVERGAAEPYTRVKLYSAAEGDVAEATAREVNLPEGAKGFVAANGRLYVFTEDTMYAYGADGALQTSYALGFACDRAVKLDEKRVLVESGGAMRLVTLK